jgi:hypothetical protein
MEVSVRFRLSERLIQPSKTFWFYLCGRPMWVRVVLGPLLWIALLAAVAGSYALSYAVTQSDQTALLLFGGVYAGTYALGYLVGTWWALAAPLLLVVAVNVLLFVSVSDDPDFGLLFWGIWLFIGGPFFFLIKFGIGRRQRSLDTRPDE